MNDEQILRNERSSFIIHRSAFVMRRSRFLPVFFVLLSIAFVIALMLRLRSDLREQTIASARTPQPPVRGERRAPVSVTPAKTDGVAVPRSSGGVVATQPDATSAPKPRAHPTLA